MEFLDSDGTLNKSLAQRKLFVPALIYSGVVLAALRPASRLGIWQPNLWPATALWLIISGLGLLCRLDEASRDPHFVRRAMLRVLSAAASARGVHRQPRVVRPVHRDSLTDTRDALGGNRRNAQGSQVPAGVNGCEQVSRLARCSCHRLGYLAPGEQLVAVRTWTPATRVPAPDLANASCPFHGLLAFHLGGLRNGVHQDELRQPWAVVWAEARPGPAQRSTAWQPPAATRRRRSTTWSDIRISRGVA